MPKRRPEKLHGIRLELQERDREILEGAIWGRLAGQTLTAAGTAIGGLGLAAGIVAGVIVWKEGMQYFQNFLDKDKEKFEKEVLSQENYSRYIQQRSDAWVIEASKQGRYAPAIGNEDNHSAWRNLDPASGAVHQALTFEVFEAENYDGPPLLYEQWADAVRAATTQRRRLLLSTLFPPLGLLGILEYGLDDWFGGTK